MSEDVSHGTPIYPPPAPHPASPITTTSQWKVGLAVTLPRRSQASPTGVESGESAPDFSRGLPFTHARRSGGVLSTDEFTTASIPLHYSGGRWRSWVQQTEAGSGVFTPLNSENTWWCLQQPTPSSALTTTSSPDISDVVFYVDDATLFPHE